MSEKIIIFLKTHTMLSHSALEQHCNIPQSTIYKAVSGKRSIPKKYFEVLEKELKKYGF